MEFFVSYCDSDGEGLVYARRAKALCKKRDIGAWVWREDCNSAKWMKSDIVDNIDSCSAMLTIVTTGTEESEPQKEEWSLADSFNKINSSMRKKGLAPPRELRGRYVPEFSDDDFNEICNRVITDIVEYTKFGGRAQTGENSAKEYQLYYIAKGLEKHLARLDKNTIDTFNKSVCEGYLGSTNIRNIVRLAEANEDDKESLVHIAIRSSIGLNEFNAKDYIWEPAFRQLGRAIATGEERFLVKSISGKVEEIGESCNEKHDELSIILKEVKRLHSIGHMPDVILAPPSMLKSFVHFFKDEKGSIDFARAHGNAATLEVKDLNKLNIYLFGGGRLSENVIIFNRSSVVWKVVPNPDTGYALTMGIGEGLYPDKVEFIIGTTVRCVVAEREGITRIPVER
jgi:hypothetical protein